MLYFFAFFFLLCGEYMIAFMCLCLAAAVDA
jgi:hypothetical protein